MQLAWTRPLPAAPLGMCLAREAGTLLVWDAEHHFCRLDRSGQVELRQRATASLVAAALSDDGRSIAAVGSRGQVWLLTADFVRVFDRPLPRPPVAVAVAPLGDRIAVADGGGGLLVFDRRGQVVWRAEVARPLVHLAFVPEAAALVGCAEFGLVCAFDRAGACLWRTGLVAHVGGLAVSGDGGRIVLACFTEGLSCYSLAQARRVALARAAPSRLVALDYRCEVTVTVGLANELALRGPQGDVRDVLLLPANPVAVAVEALGEGVYAALADGTIARAERPMNEPRTQ